MRNTCEDGSVNTLLEAEKRRPLISYSHIEEVESDAVEAFAGDIRRQGTAGRVLAVWAGQRQNHRLAR